jgi:hypothetical protein
MYYFNLYSAESPDTLKTWYADWISYGYTYDLRTYANWDKTDIEAVPLVNSQRSFMSFVNYARDKLGLSDNSVSALHRWCLGWRNWSFGKSGVSWNYNYVQEYFRSEYFGFDQVMIISPDLTDDEIVEIWKLS